MPEEEYLTVQEAAEKLSISPRSVQRYCREGRLNHKWVQGKRHKELRIVPPISFSNLPGVRKKKVLTSFDYVTKPDIESITEDLRKRIQEKELHIQKLEMEIIELKALIKGQSSVSGSSHGLGDKTDMIIHDFETVRPKERKLIVKMAEEIKTHGEFLKTLGMTDNSENTD